MAFPDPVFPEEGAYPLEEGFAGWLLLRLIVTILANSRLTVNIMIILLLSPEIFLRLAFFTTIGENL